MPSFWHRWRRELSRSLTIMVVPHGIARPRQMSFSLPFLVFLFTFWTGFTVWATYMASQRFDYWRVKTNSQLLRIKLDYFAKQVRSSREMLDDVKEMDAQLRTLVNMGSKDAIIQSDTASPQGSGGPSVSETASLQNALDGRLQELSFQDISQQFSLLREEAAQRLSSFREISEKIDHERRLFRCTPRNWPTEGHISSFFGERSSPIHGNREIHKGVDIAAFPGSPVRATADGVVVLAGWAGGYGKVAVIDHGFGFSTRYGHNRQVLVKRGDRVKRGQILSLIGSTGNATGPHCHYEVWQNGQAVNPGKFMNPK